VLTATLLESRRLPMADGSAEPPLAAVIPGEGLIGIPGLGHGHTGAVRPARAR
jgi:hypothetical protein